MAAQEKQSEQHPIVLVVLVISGLLTVSLARDYLQFSYALVMFLILASLLKLPLKHMLADVRNLLPISIIFFGIHLFFSIITSGDMPWQDVIARESIVLFRFIGLSVVMGMVHRQIGAERLVDALKTASDKLSIRSRLIEDILQILRLIMAFIPQVTREYQGIERFNSALGFQPPAKLKSRVKFYSENLMPVLSRSLTRAQQLGHIMSLRGYGRVIPRGQLHPLPMSGKDRISCIAIMVMLGSSKWLF